MAVALRELGNAVRAASTRQRYVHELEQAALRRAAALKGARTHVRTHARTLARVRSYTHIVSLKGSCGLSLAEDTQLLSRYARTHSLTRAHLLAHSSFLPHALTRSHSPRATSGNVLPPPHRCLLPPLLLSLQPLSAPCLPHLLSSLHSLPLLPCSRRHHHSRSAPGQFHLPTIRGKNVVRCRCNGCSGPLAMPHELDPDRQVGLVILVSAPAFARLALAHGRRFSVRTRVSTLSAGSRYS